MCLSTLDEKTIQYTYGWKIFRKRGKRLLGQFFSTNESRIYGYPVNTWITDKNIYDIKIRPDNRYFKSKYIKKELAEYSSGFHFYKTRNEARGRRFSKNHTIRKILVKNVVASGYRGKERVGVARQMMILTDKT